MASALKTLLYLLLLSKLKGADFIPIAGGRLVKSPDGNPKYPYIVSLQEKDSANQLVHFCGGSLLTASWILTAAHCTWRKNVNCIFAVIGRENITHVPPEERYSIQRVEYMQFHTTDLRNDISLVRLNGKFRWGNAWNYAKLPDYGMRANRNRPCRIIGYGALSHSGEAQRNLRDGEVIVITRPQCRMILGRVWAPQPGDNTVCAMGPQDTCQGDSGGPLICSYKDVPYVYGIVSHGGTCGVRVPSIYTVTIPYLEWIRLVIMS